jgi:hypothetical protein
MATYYVNPGDHGSNIGTQSNPWTNLQSALDAVTTAGDIIYAQGIQVLTTAMVIKKSGTSAKPILIIGTNSSWVVDGTRFVLDGNSVAVNCISSNNFNYNHLRYIDCKRATSHGIVWTTGLSIWFLLHCSSYNNGGAGFYSPGLSVGHYFSFCSAYSNGASGFNVGSSGFVCSFYGCSSYSNTGSGFISPGEGYFFGCLSYSNTVTGFLINGTSYNVSVIGCTSNRNGSHGFSLTGGYPYLFICNRSTNNVGTGAIIQNIAYEDFNLITGNGTSTNYSAGTVSGINSILGGSAGFINEGGFNFGLDPSSSLRRNLSVMLNSLTPIPITAGIVPDDYGSNVAVSVPSGLAVFNPGLVGELRFTITNIASYADTDIIRIYDNSTNNELGATTKLRYVGRAIGGDPDYSGGYGVIPNLTDGVSYTVYAKGTSNNFTYSVASATATGTPTAGTYITPTQEAARNKFNTGTSVAYLAINKSIKLLNVDYVGTLESVPIPGIPTSFQSYSLNYSTIRLRWDFSTVTVGFKLYRSDTLDGVYTLIATITTDTYYDDTGFTAGTTKYYKLSSYNATGEGTQTAAIIGTTESGLLPILTRQQTYLASAIQGLRIVDGYFYDWGLSNLRDEAAKLEAGYPNAVIEINREVNQDQQGSAHAGAYDNYATCTIRVAQDAAALGEDPRYSLNPEQEKALDDIKRFFGLDPQIGGLSNSVQYKEWRRSFTKNGDVLRPGEMELDFEIWYTQDRQQPSLIST